MQDLDKVINEAVRIKELNNLPFVTIWETSVKGRRSYGFNFDKKPIGFKTKQYGSMRIVIDIY